MRSIPLTAALVLIAVVGTSGCGRSLMPTPALYYGTMDDPFATVHEGQRSNLVEILYVTDRAPLARDGSAVTYGSGRSPSLAVGRTRVRIGPPDLGWSDLVRASRSERRDRELALDYAGANELLRLPDSPWYINLARDPSLTKADVQAAEAAAIEQFHGLLADALETADRKEVYVFVHGFNNTFEYAAESMAQLWHMAGRPGVAVLYSWPAATAGLFGYNPDRESSEFTVSHLKQCLRMMASCDAVERVHTISHSRGTDVLGAALRELHIDLTARGQSGKDELKLGNVVFAAADIDMDVASQRLGGEEVWKVGQRMTIYTGAGDKALSISADMFKSSSRLGQAGPEAVKDYSRTALHRFEDRFSVIYEPRTTGFLSHSYFLDNPAVSSDLILLLRDDLPPGAEHGRPLRRDASGVWIIPDGYPNLELRDVVEP